MEDDFYKAPDPDGPQKYAEHLRREIHHSWMGPHFGNRSGVARTGVAVCLILFGALLFLSNLGLFSIRPVWNYWPLILIAFGVVRGLGRPSIGGFVWAAFLIVAGVVILLLNLGVLHIRSNDDSWPLSLLVVAFGVLMLIRALEGKPTTLRMEGLREKFNTAFKTAPVSGLRDWAILGSVKRRLEVPDFDGGEAISIFGSVEIDLRRAHIANMDRVVTVDATSIFGAVKMRVPENWRLNMQGVGILGSFEDKTITASMPGFEAPVLIVTGFAIFGSVEIEN